MEGGRKGRTFEGGGGVLFELGDELGLPADLFIFVLVGLLEGEDVVLEQADLLDKGFGGGEGRLWGRRGYHGGWKLL